MAESDRLKLFVGGLSRDTSDATLREHFSKYGFVVECVVATDRVTGARRGFGFVTLGDAGGFERALKDCHYILERRVDVKQAIPRSEQLRNQHQSNGLGRNSRFNNDDTSNSNQMKTKKIFVGGLSPNLTENEFASYFSQFGTITDVVVMQDNLTNRPRGFGFITFDLEETVEEVTRKSFHELGGKFVEVKRAVPKDELILKNNNSHNSRAENGTNSFRGNNRFENFVPYPDPYSVIPVFRPVTLGYPYYSFMPINPVYPVPVAPAMSPLPFGSFSPFYPTYLSNGVGVLPALNGGVMYNGYANMEVYKDSSESGNVYEQVEANLSTIQITEISN